jgi:hypothetical protein
MKRQKSLRNKAFLLYIKTFKSFYGIIINEMRKTTHKGGKPKDFLHQISQEVNNRC